MKISELKGELAHLRNLNNINVILGRNGSGKSRFLRRLEQQIQDDEATFHIRYVSPERAGSFKRNGDFLTNITNNPNWLRQSRAFNQVQDFKSASAMLLRETEIKYLRKLESSEDVRKDFSRTFKNDRISKINSLLTNINLEFTDSDFQFMSISNGEIIDPENISSGESEAVSLASEILNFFDTIKEDRFNILLLDEPDVHLHPDLQARLANFIISMLKEFESQSESIAICIATHSSPLVCALASSPHVSIGTKGFGVDMVDLRPAGDELRKVAPFFGHPLSLSLSKDAPLILEGEDDERVWQQAARTSQGRIKVFPVLAGSVDQQNGMEQFCRKLLKTIYDDPIAFSLRDGDGKRNQTLDDLPPVKRYCLQCYAIENVLLTDPCLKKMGTSWDGFVGAATAWLEDNQDHRDAALVRTLIGAGDRLRHQKIKDIRQLVCAIVDCKKPWEVVVGQSIGELTEEDLSNSNMLVEFLGPKMVKDIIFRD